MKGEVLGRIWKINLTEHGLGYGLRPAKLIFQIRPQTFQLCQERVDAYAAFDGKMRIFAVSMARTRR
jgi:hypothetical protein